MGRKNTKKKGGDTDRQNTLDNSGFNEEDDEDVNLQVEENKQTEGK